MLPRCPHGATGLGARGSLARREARSPTPLHAHEGAAGAQFAGGGRRQQLAAGGPREVSLLAELWQPLLQMTFCWQGGRRLLLVPDSPSSKHTQCPTSKPITPPEAGAAGMARQECRQECRAPRGSSWTLCQAALNPAALCTLRKLSRGFRDALKLKQGTVGRRRMGGKMQGRSREPQGRSGYKNGLVATQTACGNRQRAPPERRSRARTAPPAYSPSAPTRRCETVKRAPPCRSWTHASMVGLRAVMGGSAPLGRAGRHTQRRPRQECYDGQLGACTRRHHSCCRRRRRRTTPVCHFVPTPAPFRSQAPSQAAALCRRSRRWVPAACMTT